MSMLAGRRPILSAILMPGFCQIDGPPLTDVAGSAEVRVETFELRSEVFHNRRSIRVLLPHGYRDPANRSRRYPVLYLNDGFAVFKAGAWNGPEAIARLESEGRIRPIILVGIDNGATAANGSVDQRTREYLPYPDVKNEPSVLAPNGALYPKFLIDEVMPAVSTRYRTLSGSRNTGLGGASYGGLAALYTVFHSPGRFRICRVGRREVSFSGLTFRGSPACRSAALE